ncbi:MAG: SBBP repeat-containing protein [Trueperaceae bacterium]|nr:SBBP repeat-containing protein [Trueperaceae bacterium]
MPAYTTGAVEGSNAGSADAFIRAYHQDGDVRWTRQFGTAQSDRASSIATDANGNVYATGQTLGAGSHPRRQCRQARRIHPRLRPRRQRPLDPPIGTTEFERARSIATDANGHVYLAGETSGALEGSNAGGSDAFIRAYDQDGNHRWTRQFGTTESEFANGVATDANGHVYVAGHTLGALEGPNAGSADAFIRAYDQNGNHRWTRQFGTTASDQARGVATDANGHAYLVGYTRGALEGSNAGDYDAFLRTYDQDGNVRWTRQFGTTEREIANDNATDANGHVYVAGETEGALEGPNAGSSDGFHRAHGR